MRKQIKAYIVHFPSFFSFFLSNSVLFCHFAFGSLHSLSFLVLSDPVHPHLLLPFISLPIILLPTSFLSHFSFVVFSYPIPYCTVISLSFHFLSFLVLPCPTLSFPFISFSVLYYPVPFCTIISFPCLSFPILSRLFLPFIVQSCPFLYCPFLSCLFSPPPPHFLSFIVQSASLFTNEPHWSSPCPNTVSPHLGLQMFHLHPADLACAHLLINFLHSSTQGPGPSQFPCAPVARAFLDA